VCPYGSVAPTGRRESRTLQGLRPFRSGPVVGHPRMTSSAVLLVDVALTTKRSLHVLTCKFLQHWPRPWTVRGPCPAPGDPRPGKAGTQTPRTEQTSSLSGCQRSRRVLGASRVPASLPSFGFGIAEADASKSRGESRHHPPGVKLHTNISSAANHPSSALTRPESGRPPPRISRRRHHRLQVAAPPRDRAGLPAAAQPGA